MSLRERREINVFVCELCAGVCACVCVTEHLRMFRSIKVGVWAARAREDVGVYISVLCTCMHGALHSLAGLHNRNRDGDLTSQMSRRLGLFVFLYVG